MGCSLRVAVRAVRSVQVHGRAHPVVAVPLGGPAGLRWLEGKKPSHPSQALPQNEGSQSAHGHSRMAGAQLVIEGFE